MYGPLVSGALVTCNLYHSYTQITYRVPPLLNAFGQNPVKAASIFFLFHFEHVNRQVCSRDRVITLPTAHRPPTVPICCYALPDSLSLAFCKSLYTSGKCKQDDHCNSYIHWFCFVFWSSKVAAKSTFSSRCSLRTELLHDVYIVEGTR